MNISNIDFDKLYDALYNRFILKDFFGKIIPGFIFFSAVVVSFKSLDYFLGIIASISLRDDFLLLFGIIGISWIIALAIQTFGETTKLIRHFPESEDINSFHNKLISLNQYVPLIERQNYERFRLTLETSGYTYVSLLISLILLTIDHIIDNNGFSNISINEIYFFVITIIFILLLRKMHFSFVNQSHQYLLKLLAYYRGVNYTSWP